MDKMPEAPNPQVLYGTPYGLGLGLEPHNLGKQHNAKSPRENQENLRKLKTHTHTDRQTKFLKIESLIPKTLNTPDVSICSEGSAPFAAVGSGCAARASAAAFAV